MGGGLSPNGRASWKASRRGSGEGASKQRRGRRFNWIKLISDLSYSLILFSCAKDGRVHI